MAVLIGFLPLHLASAMQPVRLYQRRNKLTDAFNETILFLAYDESFPIVEELKKRV